jgi:hypothetical protein
MHCGGPKSDETTVFKLSKAHNRQTAMDIDDVDDEDWSLADEVFNAESDDESVLEFDDTDVVWRACGAREILLDDLHRGILPLDAEILSAEEAWETYSVMDAFELVPFSGSSRLINSKYLSWRPGRLGPVDSSIRRFPSRPINPTELHALSLWLSNFRCFSSIETTQS